MTARVQRPAPGDGRLAVVVIEMSVAELDALVKLSHRATGPARTALFEAIREGDEVNN
jgi:hypothetical protein